MPNDSKSKERPATTGALWAGLSRRVVGWGRYPSAWFRLWPGYRPVQCNPRIQVTGAPKLRLARPALTPPVRALLQSAG
jgi:hypothetical protein